MLYLAGQILAYVLVAMFIGAALAWVFLIAPLRRQVRQTRDGQPDPRAGGYASIPDAGVAGAGMADDAGAPLAITPRARELGGTPLPGGAKHAVEPAERKDHVFAEGARLGLGALPGPAPSLDADELRETGERLEDGTPTGLGADESSASPAVAGTTGPDAVGAELATTGPIALPINAVRVGEPVAELVALLRRQRDDAALEKADLTARLAVAEQRAAESEQRIGAAERHAITASARVEEIEATLRARIEAATSGAGAGVGGERAADDGSRADAATAPADAGLTVAELAREAELLRQQLAEAEGRAAKFSSRLAMARTEAEDSQRLVATMITRLDRHQAEWAAERISLLGRISRTETETAEPIAAPEASTRESSILEAGRRVEYSAAVEYVEIVGTAKAVASARAARSARAAAPLRPLAQTRVAEPAAAAGPADVTEPADVAEPAVGVESAYEDEPVEVAESARPAEPVRPDSGDLARAAALVGPGTAAPASGTESGRPGTLGVAGMRARTSGVTKERPSAVAGVLAPTGGGSSRTPGVRSGATGEQAAGGRVVQESAPRWNGLLDPVVAGGDNLKEIVGIGPVIESRLRTLGITAFSQLAEMGDTDVERLAHKLDGFGDRIISDDWVGQAQDLQVRHYGGVYIDEGPASYC
ncbi:hypothetical protein [Candidatus Frankia alpina]|uniref:hypothetical protein n=1 Tax=Candidatus Frankia alpina TaxID=2699483 RepID=UPI0013D3097C|nr:hypothetical protein [Candidatus Frankia alpina]